MERLIMSAVLMLTSAPSIAGDINKGVDPQLFKNILLLQVLGSVTVPMSFNPDGTVFYIDIDIKPDGNGFEKSHATTAKWTLANRDLCVLLDDSRICFENIARKPGEVVKQEIRNISLATGKQVWSGTGLMMLMGGRTN